MIDKIPEIIESKGFLVGFFAGLLKVMQDIRMSAFKWYIALTDVIASTGVGYSVYEWASESETLSKWQVIGLTIFLSLNAFVVVKIITDPNLVKKMLGNWFKTPKS